MGFEGNHAETNETDTCDDSKEASAFRRFVSQFVATTIKNMLIIDLSLCYAFSGIVIPALTGIQNDHNLQETLTMTAVEASWFGSISYIIQPIGSILASLVTDSLGRKRTMIAVNVPFTIAWFMMYNATSVFEIFVANSLMGFAIGFMQSPTITYIGEICEPSNRGFLIAYTVACSAIGNLIVFGLNTLMPWRTIGLFCMFVPIITVVGICFLPETPSWLLAKNRHIEAEKALAWLRGWVSPKSVHREFQELKRYSQLNKSCASCVKNDQICTHPLPTLREKCAELKRKKTLKPLFILFSLIILSEFTGMSAMTPFMIQIFKAYDSPIAPDKAAAFIGVTSTLANVTFLCLIRFTTKRKINLAMLSITFLSTIIIVIYGFTVLPSGYNSFDHSGTFVLDNQLLTYIPFICIILWNFGYHCIVHTLPFQLMSEVFPYKVRGIAAGLSAALDYSLRFVAIRTYYNLEVTLSMPGLSLFNCLIAGFGIYLMYKIMPETENRTLEDIEMHFSDNTKKITDWKIDKINSSK